MAGALILVVGPSGAGKDTLIAQARAQLANDDRFAFARRVVTREAIASHEDHDTITPAQFDLRRRCGGFALCWEAHGLGYGVPAPAVDSALLVGRAVVANVSRSVVREALDKYAACHVVSITASPEVRAARLRSRGRETVDEIAARLAREPPLMPAGIFATIIENSGAVEDGVRRFVDALKRLAR